MVVLEVDFPEYEYEARKSEKITLRVDTDNYFKSVNEVIEF
jgi:hypothetical protein